MKKPIDSKSYSAPSLDTLALRGTNKITSGSFEQNIIVSGEGSDRSKTKALKGRAKRKIITQKLMLSLVDIAKEKGTKERENGYWNTYHCQSKLIGSKDRIYGDYCKNRFCNICTSIRKAELINKYLPIVKTWNDTQFVTLTVSAVKAEKLHEHVRAVKKKFNQIIDLLNKRHRRGKGEKPIGIWSLESNFNPVAKTYNPHLHILVSNQQMADRLSWEWRKKWPKGYTNIWHQKIRKVKNNEDDLVETIKYGTKIFTAPDMKKKSKIPPIIYANALDNIHAAFKGIHIFSSFGIKLPKQKAKNKTSKIIENYEEWDFNPYIGNWVDLKTGEVLSDYSPSAELEFLLENNINTELS